MSLTDTDFHVSMPSTPTTPTCDPEFFYSFVDFEVDDVSFCLPTQPFEQSPFFVELFKEQPLPDRSQGSAAQNVRDVQRYVLKDVSAEEFRDFLRILLDCPWRRTVSNVRALKFSPSAYLSFMRLATLWRFDAMREEVANDLYDFDNPAFTLLIGTKFEQKQLINSGLRSLVQRIEPLEPEDYDILGLDLAIRVAKCREYCRTAEGGLPALVSNDIFGLMMKDDLHAAHRTQMQKTFGEKFALAFEEGLELAAKRPRGAEPCRYY